MATFDAVASLCEDRGAVGRIMSEIKQKEAGKNRGDTETGASEDGGSMPTIVFVLLGGLLLIIAAAVVLN